MLPVLPKESLGGTPPESFNRSEKRVGRERIDVWVVTTPNWREILRGKCQ